MDFDHILSSFASQLAPQQKEATVEGFGTKGQWEYQTEIQYSPTITESYSYAYAPAPTYTVIIESPHAVADVSPRPSIETPLNVTPYTSQTQTAEQGMAESDKSLMYVVIAAVLGGLALMFLK